MFFLSFTFDYSFIFKFKNQIIRFDKVYNYKPSDKEMKILSLNLYSLILWITLMKLSYGLSSDNVCTFNLGGKVFSLIKLQKKDHYKFELDKNQSVYINFCAAFTPPQCNGSKTAYSFLVTKNTSQVQDLEKNQTKNVTLYSCERYSSNSYLYLFTAKYVKEGNLGTLQYLQQSQNTTNSTQLNNRKQTKYQIKCSDNTDLNVTQFEIQQNVLKITGTSLYGCPVFQVSSLWQVFKDNWILIGIILFIMGLHLLFFGRVTIETTIFIASFLIVFAVVGSIFTLFVSPNSSTIVIYIAFLILLFSTTMMAYGVTKLVNLSIFFVGAILGFIIGMLVNSLFCSIFNIYSVWSLVIFQILFTIPFGLLSFKYTDEIIIASSSLTGAYLIVRPISWLFGGFPNEFLLYQMVQTKQLKGIPWTFYLYLALIIGLAILGVMYQLIKLYREHPGQQLQINFIQQSIEQPIDRIKMNVDKLIDRFKSDKQSQNYRKMREMKEPQQPRFNSDDMVVRPKKQQNF